MIEVYDRDTIHFIYLLSMPTQLTSYFVATSTDKQSSSTDQANIEVAKSASEKHSDDSDQTEIDEINHETDDTDTSFEKL